MSKSLQIFLLAGLLVTILCQGLLSGHILFNTFTDNSSQCNMNVNGFYLPDAIIINTFFSNDSNHTPSQIVAPCNYHNFVMDSMFGDDPINYTIALGAASNNPTMVGGYFLVSDLQNLNGTSCISLPQNQKQGVEQYLCRVLYDRIVVYFALWGSGNFTIDNSTIASLVFVHNVQNTQNVSALGNEIQINSSFPAIVGALYEECNTGVAGNISSLSGPVTVATPLDLGANLPGMWLAYTLIKQSANAGLNHTGQYSVVVSNSNATLFGRAFTDNCWSMGVNYTDILPNMDLCAQGCDISFVLQDSFSRVYVLQTGGVATIANISSNNTGNVANNTGNNTLGNNTQGNNTGNNTVVSSALLMSLNVALMLMSLLYLIKL